MPASPTTRKKRPRPVTASSRPARNSSSSSCRPTKTASVRWWGGGIAGIIPLSRADGKERMPPPASTSEAHPGEAAPEEAAIACEQPRAADHGMSADHEVGHDPLARTAAAAVAEERLAGDVNRSSRVGHVLALG